MGRPLGSLGPLFGPTVQFNQVNGERRTPLSERIPGGNTSNQIGLSQLSKANDKDTLTQVACCLADAMSVNYVVRRIGYSLGSAIGGRVLAAGTTTGHLFPNNNAYTSAALIGIAAMTITTITCLALARQRSPEAGPNTAPRFDSSR